MASCAGSGSHTLTATSRPSVRSRARCTTVPSPAPSTPASAYRPPSTSVMRRWSPTRAVGRRRAPRPGTTPGRLERRSWPFSPPGRGNPPVREVAIGTGAGLGRPDRRAAAAAARPAGRAGAELDRGPVTARTSSSPSSSATSCTTGAGRGRRRLGVAAVAAGAAAARRGALRGGAARAGRPAAGGPPGGVPRRSPTWWPPTTARRSPRTCSGGPPRAVPRVRHPPVGLPPAGGRPAQWGLPRLGGPAKAALVEIQMDEYGDGRLERMHAELFRRRWAGSAWTPAYGAYLDAVPAITLATNNVMSLFGLHRRLRGALLGHLAAFEMTSSLPNRRYGNGLRRLGAGRGGHPLLRRARGGGRGARADRRARHVRRPGPASEPAWPVTCCSARAAPWRWTAPRPGISWTGGDPGASGRWRRDGSRRRLRHAVRRRAVDRPRGLRARHAGRRADRDGPPHDRAVPLREVGQQTVLRRHPQGDRVQDGPAR